MSTPIDYDEATEQQLKDRNFYCITFQDPDPQRCDEELAERARRRSLGRCDYCGHPAGIPITWALKTGGQVYRGGETCKFPNRHNDAAAIASQIAPGERRA